MLDITNHFKIALQAKSKPLIGLFMGLANPYTAELLVDTGFDWLLIDAEHGPNDLNTVLAQLQATQGRSTQIITRIKNHDSALIKQMLDIGVQNLLVPMVESADQARDLVSATRYPPNGIRGVGTALARAARWNGVPAYFQKADNEICLIAQCESQAGLDNLDDILTVDGIDAVFVGPSDLAASMGHIGNAAHPDVRAAVMQAINKIIASGRAAGVFATKLDDAYAYCDAGVSFVAIGTDTLLLRQSAVSLAQAFESGQTQATGSGY